MKIQIFTLSLILMLANVSVQSMDIFDGCLVPESAPSMNTIDRCFLDAIYDNNINNIKLILTHVPEVLTVQARRNGLLAATSADQNEITNFLLDTLNYSNEHLNHIFTQAVECYHMNLIQLMVDRGSYTFNDVMSMAIAKPSKKMIEIMIKEKGTEFSMASIRLGLKKLAKVWGRERMLEMRHFIISTLGEFWDVDLLMKFDLEITKLYSL